MALPCVHIAVLSQGVLWQAGAQLTAQVRSKVPVVRGTLIAVLPYDIRPARAVPSHPVTVAGVPCTVGMQGAQLIAGTAAAIAQNGAAKITSFALSAVMPISVVETIQAHASPRVTCFGIGGIDVVVTLTRATFSAILVRVPKVTGGAAITT